MKTSAVTPKNLFDRFISIKIDLSAAKKLYPFLKDKNFSMRFIFREAHFFIKIRLICKRIVLSRRAGTRRDIASQLIKSVAGATRYANSPVD